VERAPPKNSNTPDSFYSRMDLSFAIIKLRSNFFTFPTTVRLSYEINGSNQAPEGNFLKSLSKNHAKLKSSRK
jgi:hypothetical protein